MKPFDLEAWHNGAEVTTRGGEPVRIICTDKKSPTGKYSIVYLVQRSDGEYTYYCNQDGLRTPGFENKYDLVMTSRKGWVNLYLDRTDSSFPEGTTFSGDVCYSLEEAEQQRAPDAAFGLIFLTCVEVEL